MWTRIQYETAVLICSVVLLSADFVTPGYCFLTVCLGIGTSCSLLTDTEVDKKMISVIIPTFNRAHLLRRAIDSVLSQSYQDVELIVVDDASTDNTATCVRSYTDPRIRYVRLETNQGACVARNVGVQHAQGEWIAFQDSDDEWLPTKLERQLKQLEDSGADVVFCAFERYNSACEKVQTFPHDYVEPGRITYEQLLFENLVSTQTILGRRICFVEVPFDEDFPRLQDWEMMLRMVQRFDVRYFNDVLVRIYEQSDSISQHPEKALAAYEHLLRIHSEAIRKNNRLTMQMCHSISAAQKSCRQPAWMPYFKEVSVCHDFLFNAQLFLTGIKKMLLYYKKKTLLWMRIEGDLD